MTPLTITLIIMGAAAILFLSDRLRPDLIALLVVIALGLSGILTIQEAFSGFSRSAVITIMAIFVLADGLRRTGMTEKVGVALLRLAGANENRLTIFVMLAGALLSLFMNNIAAASVLLPAVSGIARRSRISPSRLLMPLAFGTILGGMATLLTSTNIIVSSLLRDHGTTGFGLLDFAPMGFPLIFVGVLYMMIWGRKLLGDKTPAQRLEESFPSEEELLEIYRVGERIIRARILPGSELVGFSLGSSHLRENYNLNVIAIERSDRRLFPLTPEVEFRAGDVLLLMGKLENYSQKDLQPLFEILRTDGWRDEYFMAADVLLIEAVMAPRSELIDQTLTEVHFREKYGVNVVAIWRGGRPIRTGLSDIKLQFGDALLMEGSLNSLKMLKTEPGLLVLTNGMDRPRRLGRKAWIAGGIMLLTLLLGAAFPDLLGEVMLCGALAMVLSGVLNMDQAYQAIDWKSVFLIAGMLPLGIAMTKTGAASSLANLLSSSLDSQSAIVMLAVMVILTTLLTQIVNGAAVAAIVAPVAIHVAEGFGADPRSIAMGIALSASMAFITPLGHPVNILVMGQGGYTFRDFTRIGLPLTILLLITLILLLPIFWPLKTG